MPALNAIALILSLDLVILGSILAIHRFPITKPIAEVIGASRALLGLLVVGNGHDVAQFVAIFAGEIVWFSMLSASLVFGFQRFRGRVDRESRG